MTTGVDNLYQLAGNLQSAIVDAFTTDGVALPTRQVITTGTPVGECESWAISWNRVTASVPGGSQSPSPVIASGAIVRSVVFSVWIFRCVATFDGEAMNILGAPTAVVLGADAKTIMTDAYVLHRGLGTARSKGTFRDACESISLGDAVPIEPLGGIAGTMMQLTAELS